MVYLNLPPQVFEDEDEWFVFQRSNVSGVLKRVNYAMSDAIRVGVRGGQLRQFFSDEPSLLTDARLFALNLMR